MDNAYLKNTLRVPDLIKYVILFAYFTIIDKKSNSNKLPDCNLNQLVVIGVDLIVYIVRILVKCVHKKMKIHFPQRVKP